MYNIYMYIYIYIYIYIGWTRWNGHTTSKNKLFFQLVLAVAVLMGYVEFVIYKCWRIFDVILWLMPAILDHTQKRKIMGVNESLHEMDSIYVLVCPGIDLESPAIEDNYQFLNFVQVEQLQMKFAPSVDMTKL